MRSPAFPFRLAIAGLFLAGGLTVSPLPAQSVDLPDKGPVPAARDAKAAAKARTEEEEKLPEKAPLPEKRPAGASADEEGSPAEETAPEEKAGKDEKPAPDAGDAERKDGAGPDEDEGKATGPEDEKPDKEKPADTEKTPGEDDEGRGEQGATETKVPPPLSAEGKQCRENLRYLGVAFTENDTVDTKEGCAIPHPLTITTLSKDVAIEPKAEMNCMMAQAMADFMQDVVQPAAERHFGKTVKTLRHASAFVCRPRNGTKILSEHAFGNALDIAAFVLSDGTSVEVKAYDPDDHASLDKAQFLNEVRAAACGPFTTVLGPGSNADHATHFHIDLRERNNRYKVCE